MNRPNTSPELDKALKTLLEMKPNTDEYFVRKNGYFYRPNSSGYTACPASAGRYTRAEADAHARHCEGVTVHHISEFPIPDDPVALKAEIASLREERDVWKHRAELQFDAAQAVTQELGRFRERVRVLEGALRKIGEPTNTTLSNAIDILRGIAASALNEQSQITKQEA